MNRIDPLQLRRIGYFCVPPLGEQEEELGWHGKNQRHLENLIEEARGDFKIRAKILEELERLSGYLFENVPEGSHANVFLCRTAVGVATPWDVPFLIKMLFWDSVLNHRDNSFISILLEGIREKGYAEDVEALLLFHQELGKPQRLFYYEKSEPEKKSENKPIPFPGIVWLREQVMEIVQICRDRGPRESEAARIAGGPSGIPQISGFLWPGAGE